MMMMLMLMLMLLLLTHRLMQNPKAKTTNPMLC